MKENNNQIQLKNFNRRSVLNYIRRNVHATKAGLASVTGLTFMAIKKILEELEELNLIREGKLETGGIGRHAVTYTVNENYGYTIGVHVNMFSTSAAVMDLHGTVLAIEHYDMRNPISTQTAFVDVVLELIHRAIKDSSVDEKKILGVGVGVPGPIDFSTGIVLTPPNLPILWYLPLKQILEQKLGYKVYVQKDTNALAVGEYWRGAGIGYSNVVYIDIDMGIGSGLIINGEINQGANYVAGEFGHITLDINGPICNCGNRGCLEALSSGLSILREFETQLPNEPSHPLYTKRNHLVIQDVLDTTNNNDLFAISIINKSAFYAGVAISNLINILDPQIIILGGILVQKCQGYFEIVRDVAYSRRMKGAKENLIVASQLKAEVGVIGAGEIVADSFFNEIVNEVLSKR
jgi:glucokinase-like ROK family protein